MHSFLQDILAEPQDDALRLIYADWLEEQGQEARAEFIRVQIAMPAAEKEAEGQQMGAALHRAAELHRREQFLLSTNNFAEFPSWAEEWWMTRGFVSRIRLRCAAWMEHGHHLVRAHPLERVELSDKEPVTHAIWQDAIHQVFVWDYVWSQQARVVQSDSRCLPEDLHESVYSFRGPWMYFYAHQEIKDALSKGCLWWAKVRAMRVEKKVLRTSVG